MINILTHRGVCIAYLKNWGDACIVWYWRSVLILHRDEEMSEVTIGACVNAKCITAAGSFRIK